MLDPFPLLCRAQSFVCSLGLCVWPDVVLINKDGNKQERERKHVMNGWYEVQVPVAVKGHAVNWIDSKATFGDPRSHV